MGAVTLVLHSAEEQLAVMQGNADRQEMLHIRALTQLIR